MLWPKFENADVANNLAITGSIKEEILDIVDVTYNFLKNITKIEKYLKMLLERYNISEDEYEEIKQKNNYIYMLMLEIGKKKNILKKGSEVDIEKVAKNIMQDFKNSRIGRITLERVN